SNVPFDSRVTLPAEMEASPQLIRTWKFPACAPLRVLVNVPSRPENGAPSTVAIGLAIALMLNMQRSSKLSNDNRRRAGRAVALATGRTRRNLLNHVNISRFLGGGVTLRCD